MRVYDWEQWCRDETADGQSDQGDSIDESKSEGVEVVKGEERKITECFDRQRPV